MEAWNGRDCQPLHAIISIDGNKPMRAGEATEAGIIQQLNLARELITSEPTPSAGARSARLDLVRWRAVLINAMTPRGMSLPNRPQLGR